VDCDDEGGDVVDGSAASMVVMILARSLGPRVSDNKGREMRSRDEAERSRTMLCNILTQERDSDGESGTRCHNRSSLESFVQSDCGGQTTETWRICT
jgi:hypothetical protein